MSSLVNLVKALLGSMFVRSKPKWVFEFDHQQINAFEFVRCSKNNFRVRSMFDKMVFDPSLITGQCTKIFYSVCRILEVFVGIPLYAMEIMLCAEKLEIYDCCHLHAATKRAINCTILLSSFLGIVRHQRQEFLLSILYIKTQKFVRCNHFSQKPDHLF